MKKHKLVFVSILLIISLLIPLLILPVSAAAEAKASASAKIDSVLKEKNELILCNQENRGCNLVQGC